MTAPWSFLRELRPAATAGAPARAVVAALHRAVGELRRAARRDPARAAEGAALCLARLGAAVEPVEDPLGSVAAGVARAVDALVPLLADDAAIDERLAGLWEALAVDRAGRLLRLAEHWGRLCGAPARASAWAERLRGAAEADELRGPTGASVACLASLVAAGRHDEALALLAGRPVDVWPERQFGVLALAARGEVDAALDYARASNPLGHRHDQEIARVCESVLLAAGRREEAYRGHALVAHARQNCLQTFKALARVYPEVAPSRLLSDLLAASPGHEGRWFATACALRFYGLAVELAARASCDPRTLCRHGLLRLDADPEFARELGLAALRSIAAGHGVEVSGDDVYAAYDLACAAGERMDAAARTRGLVRAALEQPTAAAAWAQQILAPELADV